MSRKLLAQTILVGFITAFLSTGCHHGGGAGANPAGGPGSESSVPGIGSGGEQGVGVRPMVGADGQIGRASCRERV